MPQRTFDPYPQTNDLNRTVESQSFSAEEHRVTAATSLNDIMIACAVRASVWLNDPSERYAEQFDQNEHACTHLLLWQGSEPIGTVRLRWFSRVARLERLTIRNGYRKLSALRALFRACINLCASKGYHWMVALARAEVNDNAQASPEAIKAKLRFYKTFGAEEIGEPIQYHQYFGVPMRCNVRRASNAVSAFEFDEILGPTVENLKDIPENELVAA